MTAQVIALRGRGAAPHLTHATSRRQEELYQALHALLESCEVIVAHIEPEQAQQFSRTCAAIRATIATPEISLGRLAELGVIISREAKSLVLFASDG